VFFKLQDSSVNSSRSRMERNVRSIPNTELIYSVSLTRI